MTSTSTDYQQNRVANTHRRPTPSSPPVAIAATLGALGGLALFCDLALHTFGPLGRNYYLVATAMALCLLGLPTAYWIRGAITTGWRRGIAVAGTCLVVAGIGAWITAFVSLFANPEAAYTQRLTPTGSASMALGMLLLGVAVLASGRLTGLRALAPLAVGLYFPVQLVIQLTFFLNGEDNAPGPNGALLGTWGLLWACAAWTSATGRANSSVGPAVPLTSRPQREERVAHRKESVVTGQWLSLSRFTGLVGLTAFVLIYVPVVGSSGQEPGFDGDPTAIGEFFRATSTTAAQLGRFILVVGLLAFAWFAIGLSLILADAERRPAWRSTTAGASALLFVASGMNGYWQAAAYRADTLTPQLATYAFDVGNLQFANSWVAMGSFALCVGWVIIRTRSQPRWLGWPTVVAGLGLIASRAFWTSDFWLLPYLLFWISMITISIRLIRSASGGRTAVEQLHGYGSNSAASIG